MSYPETAKWIAEHYPELQEKYPDEWIAVHNNKVLAHGREFGRWCISSMIWCHI
ncbi:MAG: DUF5678 domain-containing protein [Methanosarcinales archaeon]